VRLAWAWLTGYLPERVLRASDVVPFFVVTRHGRWESERNAFELGHDYERGQQRAIELTERPSPIRPGRVALCLGKVDGRPSAERRRRAEGRH
jgi:hypothetical protein